MTVYIGAEDSSEESSEEEEEDDGSDMEDFIVSDCYSETEREDESDGVFGLKLRTSLTVFHRTSQNPF